MADSSPYFNEVKSRQQRIVQEINKVKSQLLRIEEGKIPASQPFISFKASSNIRDLRSPHRNLKEALQYDLHVLQNLFKQLESEKRNKKEKLARKEVAQIRERISRHLISAARDGVLDDQETKKGLALAQSALKSSILVLKVNPSNQNIKTTLDSLANALVFGADIERGIGAEAYKALTEASKTRHANADTHFRNSPNTKNLAQILQELALAQAFGAEISDKPIGWKPVGNKSHSVAPGDTLSGLSDQYYSKKGYWDVIYLENFGVIGDKPDQLKIGTVLVIP